MVLKAILFDFNGVIVNDEIIHQKLIDELLLRENLPPSGNQYQKFCLGRSDRACIKDILEARGRVIGEEYLDKLIQRKAQDYRRILEEMEKLPSCDRITEFILSLQSRHLSLGIITGALRTETEYILEKMNIRQYFSVIVAGDDIKTSKPSGDGYLLAVEKLNQQNPSLELKPSECLVIEDTPAGIEAGKNAGMAVVGVANTYPLHLLQRQANWCVDNLMQLDLDWINDTMKANFTL
ncbi:HAD family phosphatase [Cyanobacterium aponinum FACHB-4101]|uniref:HAD family hydrolase n=1 Tax=Cyanobacterium aponinum TaxID=379064 RepID=UPI001681A753|nr:HAD family phosphatase [Cyanobacterium aponinum]MBD2394437.1 HAD family phosphatase [Cyanobacterium aponinum FACHB-4101]